MDKSFLIIFILSVHFSPALYSQDTPFSEISLIPGAKFTLNKNAFHNYWEPGKSYNLKIMSPFYYGEIGLGIEYQKFESIKLPAGDFDGYYASLHWEYPFELLKGVIVIAGFHTGINVFAYDDEEDIGEAGSIESETAAGFFGGVRINFGSQWFVAGGIDYRQIFTHNPIELSFFYAGVGKTFETPGWLREFLQ